jgi:hypothetical protein
MSSKHTMGGVSTRFAFIPISSHLWPHYVVAVHQDIAHSTPVGRLSTA